MNEQLFIIPSNKERKAAQRITSRNEYHRARWMGSGIVPPAKGWQNAEKREVAIALQKRK